jgi:AbrB family looped-hinge helix DNA binding protein
MLFSATLANSLVSGKILNMWNYIFIVGFIMEVVKIDRKGRLLIPKDIREKAGIKVESLVMIKVREKSIVLEPVEPVADKYFGAFRVAKWPEDLDEFVVGVMRDWWSRKAT